MTQARLEQGWLRVPYDGPELTLIEIGVGDGWYPAFLDWDASGRRVAQIRPPAGDGDVPVRLRSTGVVTAAGTVRLGDGAGSGPAGGVTSVS